MLRLLLLACVLLVGACDLVVAPVADVIDPSRRAVTAGGPESDCARDCAARAKSCSATACARGCNLALDRLVEGEGRTVVDCVAASRPRCDDHAWARCATRIGPFADGGPPPPAPPSTDEPEDDDP